MDSHKDPLKDEVKGRGGVALIAVGLDDDALAQNRLVLRLVLASTCEKSMLGGFFVLSNRCFCLFRCLFATGQMGLLRGSSNLVSRLQPWSQLGQLGGHVDVSMKKWSRRSKEAASNMAGCFYVERHSAQLLQTFRAIWCLLCSPLQLA